MRRALWTIPLLLLAVVLTAAEGDGCLGEVEEAVEQAATEVAQLQTPEPQQANTSLDVERPPLKEKQEVAHRGQLWQGFAVVMNEERLGFGDRFPGDECYFGAADAAYQLGQKKWSTMALSELAKGIILAPIGQLNTGSVFGNALLKAGAYVITSASLGTDNIGEAAIKSVTEQTAGYILGRATNDFVGGLTAGPLTDKFMKELLEKDGVEADSGETTNTISRVQAPPTHVKVALFYNPYTHFVVASIGPDCGQVRYLVRYEIDGNGQPIDLGAASILAVSID